MNRVTLQISLGLALLAGVGDAALGQKVSQPTPIVALQIFKASDLPSYHKPDKKALRQLLTPLQYQVTQEEYTETPFQNRYWDNHLDGIYVDVVSGEPLFSSLDKFESGTGWPSFTRPLVSANITTRTDRKLGYERTEVRSRYADSHLGHLFHDGPRATGGLRYCMNSAALRFIPVTDLKRLGYGEFADAFKKGSSAELDRGRRP